MLIEQPVEFASESAVLRGFLLRPVRGDAERFVPELESQGANVVGLTISRNQFVHCQRLADGLELDALLGEGGPRHGPVRHEQDGRGRPLPRAVGHDEPERERS